MDNADRQNSGLIKKDVFDDRFVHMNNVDRLEET